MIVLLLILLLVVCVGILVAVLAVGGLLPKLNCRFSVFQLITGIGVSAFLLATGLVVDVLLAILLAMAALVMLLAWGRQRARSARRRSSTGQPAN